MSKVLVTGGLGFIGSHTVVELMHAGFEVVIADNLSNAEHFILDRIEEITKVRPLFYEIDVSDKNSLTTVFQQEKNISLVIHFAAYKAVGESYRLPLKYFSNNLSSLITVLAVMEEFDCANIVFSSSATVYGEPDEVPVNEMAPMKKALSAYGSTKQICEEILEKVVNAGGVKAISLRYFNPVGAHASGLLGELPKGVPNNLMPFITQVAAGIREALTVFGEDYDTADGTCVRDYIHVVDLAKAHVRACKILMRSNETSSCQAINIATGNGVSVYQLLKAFELYNNIRINYKVGERRLGDAPSLYADPAKANEILGWKAELGIREMVTSAWQWQKKITEHSSNT